MYKFIKQSVLCGVGCFPLSEIYYWSLWVNDDPTGNGKHRGGSADHYKADHKCGTDAPPVGAALSALTEGIMGDTRPDKYGAHRQAYEKNKKRILSTQNVCGICGRPVDMSLAVGDPLAPCIDHIIPVAKGGHPSDIDNLQLAHWTCNRQKSDKLFKNQEKAAPKVLGNRNLPQSRDWAAYRSG